MWRFLRFALRYGALGMVLSVFYATTVVSNVSDSAIYDELESVPRGQAGVVLGTSRKLSTGAANPYFQHRMDAAAQLYKSGKVPYLLTSGDFRRRGYNEPAAMREALVARGVPSRAIYLDNRGLDTFDSVLRAHQVYALDRFVVVSQRFHAERAVYIGRSFDIDVVGFAAEPVTGALSVRTNLREYFARLKAVIDVMLLRRSPSYGTGENAIP